MFHKIFQHYQILFYPDFYFRNFIPVNKLFYNKLHLLTLSSLFEIAVII